MALPTAPAVLRDTSTVIKMQPFWFGSSKEYDMLCQPFTNCIRAAGENALSTDDDILWESVDGKIARVILCDQLSRNCFRGTDEAFAYDDTSLLLARELTSKTISETYNRDDSSGEIYPSYISVLVTTLMHSEDLVDHENNLKLVEWGAENAPQTPQLWNGLRKFELEHKMVIDQFGRYPHRNSKKGRENTSEEEKWLSNVDDLPVWAKSQG
eukprot:scaffold31649_cov53-Attheya_sp.AAC.3